MSEPNPKPNPNASPSPKPYVEPVVGTDRLGRAFTDAERDRFEALLVEHEFLTMRVVALKFAFKLTGDAAAAHGLVGRASLRLVRQGWDPNVVTLVRRLCRLVWSERTHELEESATMRAAEETFLRTMELEVGKTGRSPEDLAARHQEAFEARAHAATHLERLRVIFEQTGDAVNLAWLECAMNEITSVKEMSERSGHPVEAFYDAADRRKRHVRRIVAADRAAKKEKEKT